MALLPILPIFAKDDAAQAQEDAIHTGNVLDNDLLLPFVSRIQSGDTTLAVPFGESATLAGSFGTLTIRSDGTYSYDAFDSLRDGQIETDRFTYTGVLLGVLPGLPLLGSNAELSIQVTGVNDLSAITNLTSPAAIGEVAGDSSTQDIAAQAASLSVSDLDVGDPLQARVVGAPSVKLDGVDAFTLPAGAAALAAAAALSFETAASNGGEVTIKANYDPAAADLDFLREAQKLTITYAVVVNDGVADSNTAELAVTITGSNDAPTIADNQSFSLDENSASGTIVGTVVASDPDGTATLRDTLSFRLVGAVNGAFKIDGASGAISVDNPALLDFETTPVFKLTVEAKDDFGASDAAQVVIKLRDVEEKIVLFGASEGDQAGFSVSDAGDFNNDGFADVIVGALFADQNDQSNAGAAYVVFGGPGFTQSVDLGQLGAQGVTLRGIAADDNAGVSVSGLGDFNGDGIADVIVGAWLADPNSTDKAGESYVVFGSADQTSTLDLGNLGGRGFRITGPAGPFGVYSGFSVSGAGDVNGDGFTDLLVGSLRPDSADSAAYLVFGGQGFGGTIDLGQLGGKGLSFKLDFAFNDASGAVSGAGDVNGDGFDDMIIGARSADAAGRIDAGQAYVVFGGPGLSGTVDLANLGAGGFTLNGAAANDFTGVSVSGAGDVNGDGFDDVIVGAYKADPDGRSGAGQSYLVFGGENLTGSFELGALGAGGVRFNGVAQADGSGRAVSGAGDVNGDGFDDVLIGAYNADPSGVPTAGETYVVFGNASLGGTIELATLGDGGFLVAGDEPVERSGLSVSGAGDLNSDGFDDVIVGALNASPYGRFNAGESYVVFGAAGP